MKKCCEKSRKDGIKEEQERWINQPANEHDNKIRQEERERIERIAEEMKSKEPDKQLYEGDKENENLMLKRAFYRGFNKALTDLLSRIKEI